MRTYIHTYMHKRYAVILIKLSCTKYRVAQKKTDSQCRPNLTKFIDIMR